VSAPPPPFHKHSRADAIGRLESESFDVLILGGGINGAGVARDLALRAPEMKTALIDKGYFGSGTSSRNSQLIHGGLRYLGNFDFALVGEALRERAILRRLSPELVEPLGFLIPFPTLFHRIYYGIGLFLYDLLAGKYNIAKRRYLSNAALTSLEPGLRRDFHSAAIYSDCRVHSARFLLENIFDAARHGAVAANYIEARSWNQVNGGYVVTARDAISGRLFPIRAQTLVDARGPWEEGENLRLVRGSHIIVPALTHSGNAVAHFHTDGRIIFVIPWGPNNTLSLVGTTDVDHAGSPDDVRITADEISYLQSIARHLFPDARDLNPISTFSSLRPLVASKGSASKASRTHSITMKDGIVKISGGKYTTYRSMSAEAVDLLCRRPCTTATAELPHWPIPTLESAVEHEMACHLTDVLFVCTYRGYEGKLDRATVETEASKMGALLGWDRRRMEAEAAAVYKMLEPAMPVDDPR
jgi:glycerol-3-phosphate dehydrogenase